MVKMIVAISQDDIIGVNNKLPWHIPDELKHFRQTTLNHSILFGRKTLESIGKKLKDRYVYCLTRNQNYQSKLYDEICFDPKPLFKKFKDSQEVLYIAGGKRIYEQFYQYADEIIVTEITRKIIKGEKLILDLSMYKKEKIRSEQEFIIYKYSK